MILVWLFVPLHPLRVSESEQGPVISPNAQYLFVPLCAHAILHPACAIIMALIRSFIRARVLREVPSAAASIVERCRETSVSVGTSSVLHGRIDRLGYNSARTQGHRPKGNLARKRRLAHRLSTVTA